MNQPSRAGGARVAGAPREKTRVLVIDDSALIRRILPQILESSPDLEVVGTAPDPLIAREKIKKLAPDVLTLDVEMPHMDGLSFLRNLMRLRPMPVVMVSSLTEKGAEITLEALEIGAVDFVSKPKIDLAHGLEAYAEEICAKVNAAARANPRARTAPQPARVIERKFDADAVIGPAATRTPFKTTDRIIAIGASTGGTEAIKEVLEAMPPDSPGIVIVQHIPAVFSTSFAQRMDGISPMIVREASDGQQILPGHVYIAPGDRHLLLERSGARYHCRLDDGPPVNRHRPSVDVLFRSVAQHAGRNAIGVMLTGMGDDGAKAMREMLDSGAPTLAQDEATSVVWGMPGAAVKAGAVQKVVPLPSIATTVGALARR